MLQKADQLQANSKKQKVQAERLRAKCKARAARAAQIANNPSAISAVVEVDSSDDEALDALLASVVEVQDLDATRKTKTSEVCVCPFPGMLV